MDDEHQLFWNVKSHVISKKGRAKKKEKKISRRPLQENCGNGKLAEHPKFFPPLFMEGGTKKSNA